MARPYRTTLDERDVFRALSHPVRRKMVSVTIGTTRSFADLAKTAGRSNATVASHLRILREAQVFRAKRDGKRVRYEVNERTLKRGTRWLNDLLTAQSS